MHKCEQIFLNFKKTENKILQTPKWFYFSNGSKYHPDFYCPEEDIYYEVVGTKQAFHSNKHKYKLMAKEYPEITFKIVNPDGELYKCFYKKIKPLKKFKYRIKRSLKLIDLKRYNFYLPEKMMDEIAKLAKKEGISRSEVIRNVLRRYLITYDLPSLTKELKAGYNPIKKHGKQ